MLQQNAFAGVAGPQFGNFPRNCLYKLHRLPASLDMPLDHGPKGGFHAVQLIDRGRHWKLPQTLTLRPRADQMVKCCHLSFLKGLI